MTEIVAVTFTEKAAGELKLRLREALERDARDGEPTPTCGSASSARWRRSKTRTSTPFTASAPSCCASGRSRRAVDPLFTVLTEPQADRLYTRAFRAWLQEALQNPPEGAAAGAAPDERAVVSAAATRTARSIACAAPAARWPSGATFRAPWQRPPFDRAAEIDAPGRARCIALADLSAARLVRRATTCIIDTDAVRRLSQQIRLEQSFGQRDLDGWEARLVDLARDRGLSRTRKGSGYKYGKDVTRSEVLAARDALFADLQQFQRRRRRRPRGALQQELAGATERYQQLKHAAGALDFADLLARARTLIRTTREVRAPPAAEVRAHLRRRVPGHRSGAGRDPAAAVGGRSRRSTIPAVAPCPASCSSSAIRSRRSTGSAAPTSKPTGRVSEQLDARGGRVLQLTTSYRSVPAIQRFVNAAFADEMRADERALQADYVPLGAVARGRRLAAGGRRAAGAEAVRPQRLLQGVGEGDRGLAARRRRRLHRLARRRENGWQVAERQADGSERRVPLQPRHIARAVPAVRQLRRGRHAQVRRRDRGARHSASARRRQGVSRPRGSRDDPRRARRDRMAGR